MQDLSGYSMLDLFRMEADTQTAVLSAGVVSIEDAEHSLAAIEPMMRAAHSLKGAARIVGLEPAVRVAHAMEEVFVAAGRGAFAVRRNHADLLLESVDFLGSIARAEDALRPDSPWMERADALVTRITTVLADAGTIEPAPRPATPSDGAPRPAPPPSPVAMMPYPPARAWPQEDVEGGEAAAASPTFDPIDRVVRVSADSLTRLVGLTGESLVASRQLRPFSDRLLSLRGAQSKLRDMLVAMEEHVEHHDGANAALRGTRMRAIREQAEAMLVRLTRECEAFEALASRSEDLSSRLHHEVITSRMRPFADGIRALPRLVRDVSHSLGKQVRLAVRGEQTGVDRDILEKLEAPLAHLIRNAIDHGIEPPERRRAAGKPTMATIQLEARHRDGMLQITISDDGSGIDVETIRARASALGLVADGVVGRLSDVELLEFLFLPGFSTRNVVTEISGRGVGLDVVQTVVTSVGGSVRVTTHPGLQTTFTLHLPITMSVIRALLVDIGGEAYAFPLTRIDRIVTCRQADIRTVEGRQYVELDDCSIGLVMAAQVLELKRPSPLSEDESLPVVVVNDHGQRFGVIVDAFIGERDVDVRPLDRRLGKVPDISGASVLDDGNLVLIVDIDDLVRSIDRLLTGRRLTHVEFSRLTEQTRRRKRILVVDDSITVREIERQILRLRGFDVDVAVDGMDGWNAVRGGHYDLVVSDVDMPRLDGIGLVTLIKSDPGRRNIPVVIVSYKDREEDRLRGLEAGASRYLTKASFHDETFLHTILDLIGEPTGEEASAALGSPGKESREFPQP